MEFGQEACVAIFCYITVPTSPPTSANSGFTAFKDTADLVFATGAKPATACAVKRARASFMFPDLNEESKVEVMV